MSTPTFERLRALLDEHMASYRVIEHAPMEKRAKVAMLCSCDISQIVKALCLGYNRRILEWRLPHAILLSLVICTLVTTGLKCVPHTSIIAITTTANYVLLGWAEECDNMRESRFAS